MRSFLIAFAVLAGCANAAPTDDVAEQVGERYITIGTDALPTLRATADTAAVIETTGDFAVVAVDAQDLEALSEEMHEHHHRCGGFMVHDTLDDALSVQRDGRKPIEYTLDRSAAVRAALPSIREDAILGTIRELSAMQNRYYQSATGAAASEWLRDRWLSFTDRKDVTVELFDQGYAQKSVILTIPGTTRPDEVVVLGGHLDSIAIGARNSHAPGADDDASGIATLTEIARVLLAKDYRPARTIKLIAYAAEEVGLRGSLAVVKEFKKRKINVVGALQLDMTNYQGSDRDIWLMKDFTDAAQNAFLIQLLDTYVGATWGYDACGYACSDHASWTRAGVPASMPFESRMNERNQVIHTKKDTLEMSNENASHAVKFARLGAAYAIEMGKGELAAPAADVAASTDDSGWRLLVGGIAGVLALAGVALVRRISRDSAWG